MKRFLRRVECATARAAAVIFIIGLITPATGKAASKFGDLAEGPYKRLVIQGAMVIPGHGGPAAGPYDIVIEKNVIKEMIPFDPVAIGRRGETKRPTGDRVIDGTGLYVMPGMYDCHMHIRTEPMEIEYVYYLVRKTRRGLYPVKNLGPKSLQDVQDKLAALGLSLGMALDAATYRAAVVHAHLTAHRALGEGGEG